VGDRYRGALALLVGGEKAFRDKGLDQCLAGWCAGEDGQLRSPAHGGVALYRDERLDDVRKDGLDFGSQPGENRLGAVADCTLDAAHGSGSGMEKEVNTEVETTPAHVSGKTR
jgi:hypothetical protein